MLVEIESLSVVRGGTRVLHDVHLSLLPGEIYGLLGPNGAGKSTTIAVALGLLAPAGGSVRVFGDDPRAAAPEARARVGVLPEQNGFYDWMTAPAYLRFFGGLRGRGLDDAEVRRRLDAVGLDARPGQTIGTYSRGMRQRLGLARALIGDPDLLILDEPTNGLDPRGNREIQDVLRDLARLGTGILLCTHRLDDVDRLCQRVGIIVGGRTMVEGPIGDLLGSNARFHLRLVADLPGGAVAAPGVEIVSRDGDWLVLDADPGRRPDTIWRELLAAGWPIGEIRSETRSLEDLYLSFDQGRAA